MGWSEGKSPTTAERRQEMGCAICARKDWLEHRYRVYLWREPGEACAANDPKPEVVLQNPSTLEELGGVAPPDHDLSSGRPDHSLLTMNEGCYCLGTLLR